MIHVKFGTKEIGICAICKNDPIECKMDPPGATSSCGDFEWGLERPVFTIKIKGDAGAYEVWGINWLDQTFLLARKSANEWVPFTKCCFIPRSDTEL